MLRCGVIDVFDAFCNVFIASRSVAGGLFMCLVRHGEKKRWVYGERGKFLYNFLVGKGERRRDLKWLTWLVLFAVQAL